MTHWVPGTLPRQCAIRVWAPRCAAARPRRRRRTRGRRARHGHHGAPTPSAREGPQTVPGRRSDDRRAPRWPGAEREATEHARRRQRAMEDVDRCNRAIGEAEDLLRSLRSERSRAQAEVLKAERASDGLGTSPGRRSHAGDGRPGRGGPWRTEQPSIVDLGPCAPSVPCDSGWISWQTGEMTPLNTRTRSSSLALQRTSTTLCPISLEWGAGARCARRVGGTRGPAPRWGLVHGAK